MSIINKMLNDLDDKEPQNEVKPEVAFLESKQQQTKPKRSKLWWLRMATGGLTIVVGVIAAFLYYSHIKTASDTLDLIKRPNPAPTLASKPANDSANQEQVTNAKVDNAASADKATKVAQVENSATGQQTTPSDTVARSNNSSAQQRAKAPANQPKLVKLKNVDENGKPIVRQSTLTVQTQANSSPSANNSSSRPQTEADNNGILPANIERPVAKVPDNAIIAQSSPRDPQVLSETDKNENISGQMSISKVKLSNQQRAQKHVVQAQKLAQQGMIQPAVEKYQQAIEVYPLHQQARVALAGLYYGRNMVAEALEVLSQGLNVEPGNRGWSLLAAKIHYSRDNYAAALAYLQLPVHPVEDVEYLVLKATTLQKLKDFAAAAGVFSQLTNAYPESARWWLGLATSFEGQEKVPEAIEAYRQTLRLGNISQSSRRFVLKRLAQLER